MIQLAFPYFPQEIVLRRPWYTNIKMQWRVVTRLYRGGEP